MIHPAKNPQPNGFDLATFAPSLDGVAGEALGTFLSDFQKGNNSMPPLPLVAVPPGISAPQVPPQTEQVMPTMEPVMDQLRENLEHLAGRILEGHGFCPQCGVVSPDDDGTCAECGGDASGAYLDELATNIQMICADVKELEGGLAVAQARIKVLEMQAPGYAEIERARIIALIEDMMRTSCVIRDGDTGVWLVLSDLLRDICNPK